MHFWGWVPRRVFASRNRDWKKTVDKPAKTSSGGGGGKIHTGEGVYDSSGVEYVDGKERAYNKKGEEGRDYQKGEARRHRRNATLWGAAIVTLAVAAVAVAVGAVGGLAAAGWQFLRLTAPRGFNLIWRSAKFRPTLRLLKIPRILRLEMHPIEHWWNWYYMYPHMHIDAFGKAVSAIHIPVVEPLIIAAILRRLRNGTGATCPDGHYWIGRQFDTERNKN